MKHYFLSFLLFSGVIYLPSSCNKITDYLENITSNNAGDVKVVKNYKPYKSIGIDVTLEELFAKAVGATGEVVWKSFKPKDFKNRSEIYMVEINSKTGDNSKKPKTISVQYLINDNTKSVEFYAAEINNKPVGKNILDSELFSNLFP